MKKILVTFDIDGTLMNCPNGRSVQIQSFVSAFRKFFNSNIETSQIWGPLGVGITDMGVTKGILDKHMKDWTLKDSKDFLSIYDSIYIKSDFVKPELTPAVRETIQELHEMSDVIIALVTGNTETTAKFKLERAEIDDLFNPFIGGFGDNLSRYDCIKSAFKKVVKNNKEIRGIIHIGDTNSDIESALKFGAIPIGVKTGHSKSMSYTNHMKYFVDDLEKGHDTILDTINNIRNSNTLFNLNE